MAAVTIHRDFGASGDHKCPYQLLLLHRRVPGCITFFFLFFFLPHGVACGILFPQPGIESETPALGLNHYTVREVLNCIFMESLDL